jgi:hypothetical protein
MLHRLAERLALQYRVPKPRVLEAMAAGIRR